VVFLLSSGGIGKIARRYCIKKRDGKVLAVGEAKEIIACVF